MFLDVLRRRNPRLVEAAVALHRSGEIPPNAYVLDLDAVEDNARGFKHEADSLGLSVFAVTKQVGRNSGFCRALVRAGIDRSVAVDMACARACHAAGLRVGHLGHLVQIPRFEAEAAAREFAPDYWTVFNESKAHEAARGARAAGRTQALLARIQAEGDIFYRGHEGGFGAGEIASVADAFDALDAGRFAGITTFPALLFDHRTGKVEPTPNLATLGRALDALAKAGRTGVEVNAPGTTSSVVLAALADAGATQCEPGNGLHGTTPLHAVEELPEIPAMVYLTEVSHLHGGRAYAFGGGLYIDPVFPDYPVRALVCDAPTVSDAAIAEVEMPALGAIDYYAMIDAEGQVRPRVGDSVVFGFRAQAFVTRAYVVGVGGIQRGDRPVVENIENGFGRPEPWPV